MSTLYYESDELQHHGIKGQKWGVRRFRNTDGSLTPAGRKRYSDSAKETIRNAQIKRAEKKIAKTDKKLVKTQAKLSDTNARIEKYKKSGGSSWDHFAGDMEQKWAHNDLDRARKLNTKKRNLESKKKTNEQIINEFEKNPTRIVSRTAMKNAAVKGANIASDLAIMSLADDIFYGGEGKKAIKTLGRAATTAFMRANGSISVEWLD